MPRHWALRVLVALVFPGWALFALVFRLLKGRWPTLRHVPAYIAVVGGALLTAGGVTLALGLLLALAGGGDESSPVSPQFSGGGGESSPVSPQFSGSATASVTVGSQTFTFENGRCDLGPDDGWLAVNIGQVGSGDYFSLLVGADPAEPAGRKLARDGGEFAGQDCGVVSATVGGKSYARAIDEACRVTLDADLKGGEFVGNTLEGEPMSGSFKC